MSTMRMPLAHFFFLAGYDLAPRDPVQDDHGGEQEEDNLYNAVCP